MRPGPVDMPTGFQVATAGIALAADLACVDPGNPARVGSRPAGPQCGGQLHRGTDQVAGQACALITEDRAAPGVEAIHREGGGGPVGEPHGPLAGRHKHELAAWRADLAGAGPAAGVVPVGERVCGLVVLVADLPDADLESRSEEHTSELQSRVDLVC